MFTSCLSYLALTLLMARVSADHAHHALAANDAAVLANATNGTTYFHCVNTLSEWSNELKVYHNWRFTRKRENDSLKSDANASLFSWQSRGK